jgi:hypothetical protein
VIAADCAGGTCVAQAASTSGIMTIEKWREKTRRIIGARVARGWNSAEPVKCRLFC